MSYYTRFYSDPQTFFPDSFQIRSTEAEHGSCGQAGAELGRNAKGRGQFVKTDLQTMALSF